MENVVYNIKINGIELADFSVVRRPENYLESEEVDIQFYADLGVNEQESLLIQNVNAKVLLKKDKTLLVNCQAHIGFNLQDFNSHIKMNAESKYEIPAGVINLLRRIGIGTLRGILFMRLQGTYLANTILPITPMDV